MIVVGTTTSGCVRATVVDAFSLNYRVILAEEGCFDRSEASHAVSLCDMHAKYADVLPTAEILSYLRSAAQPTCSICPPAVAAQQRRSGRPPNRAFPDFTRRPVSTGNRLSLIEWALPLWGNDMHEQFRRPLLSPTTRGVHHLALCTDDMKATIDFYVEVLGMPLVHAMKVPPGLGTGPGNRGNPPYEQVRHYFFDMGNDSLLAFFEIPKGENRRATATPSAPCSTAPSSSRPSAFGKLRRG